MNKVYIIPASTLATFTNLLFMVEPIIYMTRENSAIIQPQGGLQDDYKDIMEVQRNIPRQKARNFLQNVLKYLEK